MNLVLLLLGVLLPVMTTGYDPVNSVYQHALAEMGQQDTLNANNLGKLLEVIAGYCMLFKVITCYSICRLLYLVQGYRRSEYAIHVIAGNRGLCMLQNLSHVPAIN